MQISILHTRMKLYNKIRVFFLIIIIFNKYNNIIYLLFLFYRSSMDENHLFGLFLIFLKKICRRPEHLGCFNRDIK